MPNLKDIRRRIKSVKNTQKITQAMRMVAAAKVKRAEARVKANRPYSRELFNVFKKLYNRLKSQVGELDGSRYQSLFQTRPVKNIGIIIMSSDRGLCGSYNSSIIRTALKLDKEIKARGLTPKYYLVGSKIIQAFARYSDSEVLGKTSGMTAAPTIAHANQVVERMLEAYLAGEIDSIEILSTDFISMISYKLHLSPLIPVQGVIKEEGTTFDFGARESLEETGEKDLRELLLEPDPVATIGQIVPMYLGNTVYIHLLEASASELAARMTAMTNATNNAAEMIGKLTIQYNKARQATITQELLEVVGGAEALN